MKLAALIATTLTGFTIFSTAQTTSPELKSGSYLYYGQPYLEDNSMLIDEAFNQEAGIIQHISNMVVSNKALNYSYTQEIPLVGHKHQLSFAFSYVWLKKAGHLTKPMGIPVLTNGFGDILLSYHPLIAGKHKWALVVPRITIIVPTGNAPSGLGNGGWGSQLNVAVTKRFSKKITAHTNTGYTYVIHADHYIYESTGAPANRYEGNITSVNMGASLVWLAHKKMHLLAEYIFSCEKRIGDDGRLVNGQLMTVNPGIRYAFDVGKVQIVPGAGIPVNFSNGAFEGTGTFLYLSVEPCYNMRQ